MLSKWSPFEALATHALLLAAAVHVGGEEGEAEAEEAEAEEAEAEEAEAELPLEGEEKKQR